MGISVGVQYQGDELGPKVFARRAEAAGFDSVWTGDHVGHVVDGLAALGILAGATERITVGVNVLVTPYRSAAVMAKALATIAGVARGRVIAGFGVGGEFPAEFIATGADIGSRGAFTDEALDAIVRLWAGEPVTFDGRWTHLEDFRLEPAPLPPPEIWIGGRSPAAVRRAARFGQGYSPYLVSPEQLRDRCTQLHRALDQLGRPAHEVTVACLSTFIPVAGVDEAIDVGTSSLRLGGLTPEIVRSRYLFGGDDDVLARLRGYVDAGARHLVLGCLPGAEADVDAFFEASTRLLPAVRALGADDHPR